MAEIERDIGEIDFGLRPAADRTFMDYIFEAKKLALKEQIKANTVLINESFAKVNGFHFCFFCSGLDLPPMICGLEVHVINELPEGYSFAVTEAPETERARICRQAKAEVVREIFEEIERTTKDAIRFCEKRMVIPMLREAKASCYKDMLGYIAELKKKYTEDQSDGDS